jgi:hypothetical protein
VREQFLLATTAQNLKRLVFQIVELAERSPSLADITSNSTISMAITKVVISENVPCNGWLWK